MEEKIKHILQFAVHAPSGENCQPWKFKIQDNAIHIYNIEERDNSLYSWGQRPSYIAHGALIENIRITAPAFGYTTEVQLFPDAQEQNYVARITLREGPTEIHPLFPFIEKRATNRKPYGTFTLTSEQKEELSRTLKNSEGARLLFLESKEDKKAVATAAAGNERILFENNFMHTFFYSHITWTKEEDIKKKIGFFIKTFELPPPAQAMFKLAKHWNVVRILNLLGFSKMIVKQNAKVYETGSALGAITIPSNSKEDYILAGQILQRVWLTITKFKLSFQPLTGIVFLAQGICKEETDKLSLQQKEFIEKNYAIIKETFGVSNNETIAMVFRIGRAHDPSAQALRLEPEIIST